MREADLLLTDQAADHVRLVTPGIDLLDAQHRRQIGEAPGVDVEHRRHRHIHVFAVDMPLPVCPAQRGGTTQGMQHQLAVAEINPLRIAGRTGGVEGGGLGVFVEIGEVELAVGSSQQGFVFAGHRQRCGRDLGFVADQHEGLHRFQLAGDLLQDGEELAIDQQHVGLGVVQRVQDLLRAEAHIHRLQDGTHHRHGEEAFEVTMAVPIHHRHRLAGFDTEAGQHVGQPADTLVQRTVGVAQLALVGDLLRRRDGQRGEQQLLDEQRIAVGGRRRLDELDWHGGSPWIVVVAGRTSGQSRDFTPGPPRLRGIARSGTTAADAARPPQPGRD